VARLPGGSLSLCQAAIYPASGSRKPYTQREVEEPNPLPVRYLAGMDRLSAGRLLQRLLCYVRRVAKSAVYIVAWEQLLKVPVKAPMSTSLKLFLSMLDLCPGLFILTT
jgi:hypothetical protein